LPKVKQRSHFIGRQVMATSSFAPVLDPHIVDHVHRSLKLVEVCERGFFSLEVHFFAVRSESEFLPGVRTAHLRVCHPADTNDAIKMGCRLSRGREA
jgi:hypothetical protein